VNILRLRKVILELWFYPIASTYYAIKYRMFSLDMLKIFLVETLNVWLNLKLYYYLWRILG